MSIDITQRKVFYEQSTKRWRENKMGAPLSGTTPEHFASSVHTHTHVRPPKSVYPGCSNQKRLIFHRALDIRVRIAHNPLKPTQY